MWVNLYSPLLSEAKFAMDRYEELTGAPGFNSHRIAETYVIPTDLAGL